MLQISQLQFAKDISVTKFKGISEDKEIIVQMQELYTLTLIYSYFMRLCSTKISLNNSAKKSYLLTEHALTGNTKTKQLMQSYIDDMDISNSSISESFPSHRKEAIDYFRKQYEVHVNMLTDKMNGNREKTDWNSEIVEQIRDESNTKITNDSDLQRDFVRPKQIIDQVLDGNEVYIQPDHKVPANNIISVKTHTLDRIFNAIKDIQQQHNQSQQQINILRERVNEMEQNQRQMLIRNNNHIYLDNDTVIDVVCFMLFAFQPSSYLQLCYLRFAFGLRQTFFLFVLVHTYK